MSSSKESPGDEKLSSHKLPFTLNRGQYLQPSRLCEVTGSATLVVYDAIGSIPPGLREGPELCVVFGSESLVGWNEPKAKFYMSSQAQHLWLAELSSRDRPLAYHWLSKTAPLFSFSLALTQHRYIMLTKYGIQNDLGDLTAPWERPTEIRTSCDFPNEWPPQWS
ncbi:unnamed protein product [Natator depressus]